MRMPMRPERQRGATLVVGLVMLVVLTLLVLSAIRSGNTNLRIVGNMQMQEETALAAVQTTEQIISTNFTASAPAPTMQVGQDLDEDGNPDYTAAVSAPVCTSSLALDNAMLDPANPADASCIASATAQNTGIVSTGKGAVLTGQSWCYLQQWEVGAQVTDARTGATASSIQGVSLRVPAGTICP